MTQPGEKQPVSKRLRTPLPKPDPDEARRIFRCLKELIEPLQRAFPGHAEVVLHDLSKLPNSIIAIAGTVTGRRVGSPATESLLRAAAHGAIETSETYDLRLPGGRELRSTNIVFRDSHGVPAYALSVNLDVTLWRAVHALAGSMLPPTSPPARPESGEQAESDVDQLVRRMLTQAIAASGLDVEDMSKRHKVAVVEDLKQRGFFLIRDSIEDAAAALHVTRFTIYNYLNELDATDSA